MLELSGISFRFKKKYLMKDYSLSVNPSEIIFLKGDSGSGKTTFLNIIATIIPRFIHGELQGKVLYQKTDLQKIDFPEIAKYIGFLRQHPQQQLFFPNVEQELAFGPENLCIPPKEILNKIDAVCSDLGIADYRFAATSSLSFGQKKMVALAANITLDPKILLLDEPTAGISEKNYYLMKNVLLHLKKKGKIIIIADHHDVWEDITGRILQMKEML